MPHRYLVSGPDLPPAPSPISQAVVAGDHCYVSGQLATDRDGTFKSDTVVNEAKLAFANLFKALEAAGFVKEDLVFIDVAFADLADISQINALWANLFPEGRRPARTVYQAAALPYGGKIKVQGVAIRQTF
jgi:2-iminobutanoate/2-iminopropanoate deaminase